MLCKHNPSRREICGLDTQIARLSDTSFPLAKVPFLKPAETLIGKFFQRVIFNQMSLIL
jgi:hypothetical protein